MPIDRRRGKRVRLALPLKFRLFLPSRPNVSSPFHDARLHDLSSNGLGLLTSVVQSNSLHILNPDLSALEQCHMEIEIPDGEQTLTLVGRAVWYDHHPGEHDDTFRVGIEFVDIGPEDRKRVQALIKQSLASVSTPSSDESSTPVSE